MREGVIYKITSPTNKIYIGQTVRFKKRMYDYASKIYGGSFAIGRSITKHGWENHIVKIIDFAPQEQLNEREAFWIKEYDTFKSPHGLNLTKGGDGVLGRTRTPEERKRMSEARKGWIPPVGFGAKISKALMGRKQSQESIDKMSASKMGKRIPQEAIERMRQTKLAQKRKMTPEEKVTLIKNLKARVRTKESGTKISASKKGKSYEEMFSKKCRKNHLKAVTGKRPSDETRLKMSNAQKARKQVMTTERKEKMFQARMRNKALREENKINTINNN